MRDVASRLAERYSDSRTYRQDKAPVKVDHVKYIFRENTNKSLSTALEMGVTSHNEERSKSKKKKDKKKKKKSKSNDKDEEERDQVVDQPEDKEH